MKTFGVVAAVIVLLLTGCGKGDDVDPNPGKGNDVPGDVEEDKNDGY